MEKSLWTLSGSAAFDGLWLERATQTLLVVKLGQIPLVTSSVRCFGLGYALHPGLS